MTEREKNKLKHRILELLKENARYKRYLSEQLKVKEEVVVYFLEEMIEAKLALLPMNNGQPLHMGTNVPINITNKGRYFLEIDGGYVAQYEKEVYRKWWTVTKIVAATLNALAIIAIGFFSLPLFDNDEIEGLQKRIEVLEKRAEASNTPRRQIAPVNAKAKKPETQPTR